MGTAKDDDSSDLSRRRLGGLSIILGNAALFANGLIAHMKGDTEAIRQAGRGRMLSGLLYMGVGGIIARYGDASVERQLNKLEDRLAAYLKERGVPLDADTLARADREQQKTWFQSIEDFAYDHPMECANVYNLLAASGMLVSGLTRRGSGEKLAGNANLASFAMIVAGTLTSLIPERTHAQLAKEGKDGTFFGKVQEQPLNFAVWPYMAGDLTYAAQSLGEYKQAQAMPTNSAFKPWANRMAAISGFVVVTSFLGDVLTGFSSKKVNSKPHEREEARDELVTFASRILARQPAQTQKIIAEQAAEYLSHQQGLRMVDVDKEDLMQRVLAATGKYRESSPRTGMAF